MKNFYNGFATPFLRQCFPSMPSYEQFVMVHKRALVPLIFFLLSRMGKQTGIYYIDSTYLPALSRTLPGRTSWTFSQVLSCFHIEKYSYTV